MSSECQRAVLEVLCSSTQLTDREFWLAEIEGGQSGTNRPWLGILRKEIARRAVAVIVDRDADAKLVTQASLVLNSMVDFNLELTREQELQLVDALAKKFAEAKQQPRNALELFNVLRRISGGVDPILPDTQWKTGESGERKANQLIVLLNVVTKLNLQVPLQESLTSLHESFQELELCGKEFDVVVKSFKDWTLIKKLLGDNFVQDRLVQQIVYLQTGLLVGKEMKALVARFKQLHPADIAVIVDRDLDSLQYSEDDQEKRRALARLEKHIGEKHAKRAAPILTDLLISQPNWSRLELAVTLLTRVSGDQFFVYFAKALAPSSAQKRSNLLAIDFSRQDNFRCNDPESLTGLMSWTDSVFASSRKEDVATAFEVAKMLRSLLRDRTQTVARTRQPHEAESGLVSESCQNKILAHLQPYTQLTDQNFWLSEPIIRRTGFGKKPTHTLPMDKPFRQAMLDRSLALLSQDANSPELDQLHSHALMVIREVCQVGDELTERQLSAVSDYLSELVEAGANDLDAKSGFHDLLGWFDMLAEPQIPIYTGTVANHQYVYQCNTLIVGLNLISELRLGADLTGPLKALHDAAGKRKISKNYFDGDIFWVYRVRNAQRGKNGNMAELFAQTVFLQTGVLLGSDFTELVQRPARLRREEYESRRRFIEPGDTLAIYIPGVLPGGDELAPPVIQAGNRSPVTGYPVPVTAEGQIQVPLIPALSVKGKELKDVRATLVKTYADDILKDSVSARITVQYLMRAGEQLELRNITGQAMTIGQRNER